ncbi:hypothetical protein NDU88_011044 [Pleurodeles waltl]|uniref:Uncharacterized protein n=1 Tax=Pleurodeles waltl TaxID=8319 RepID=A0AAV7PWN3_PLEWA|nr:hypothetical protein NDU88_011044 [Pleurodeles waltl]
MMERDAELCRLSVQPELLLGRAGAWSTNHGRPPRQTRRHLKPGTALRPRRAQGREVRTSAHLLIGPRAQVASRIDPHERSKFRLSAQSLSTAEGKPAHFPEPQLTGPRLKVCGPEARQSLCSAPSSSGHQNEAAASSRGPG